MENTVETVLGSRKEWAKPELKKIDIEQITATHPAGALSDGPHKS